MGASAEMREASSAARVRAAVRLALEANSRSRSCTRAMHRSTVTVTTCGHTVSIRANLRRSIHVSFWVRHVRENRESRPDRDFFSLGRAGRVESPNPGMRVHPSPSSPGNYPLSRVGHVGIFLFYEGEEGEEKGRGAEAPRGEYKNYK